MIPKVIHYCWFGGNPLPKELQDYIDTWKEKCPDYEIKCWNESKDRKSTIKSIIIPNKKLGIYKESFMDK